jgi:hypothetical protein
VTPLPILLCLPTPTSRDVYRRCLYEAQFLSPPNKTGLAKFILESMASSIRSVVVSLDLTNEEKEIEEMNITEQKKRKTVQI